MIGNNFMEISLSEDGIKTIRLCRPEKKNALSKEMYKGIISALGEAADDPKTKMVVLTGQGDYFSSGNDLSNFLLIEEGSEVSELIERGLGQVRDFVDAFINFPKLIFALVNGPAVGIMVTVLALCDVVYAVEEATFLTPFSQLGQSPEGCSTLTFPKLMNRGKAIEILCFNRKVEAHEAEKLGLVTRTFKKETFHSETSNLLKAYAGLPSLSLNGAKALVRKHEVDQLKLANFSEMKLLADIMASGEFMDSVMSFLSRKSKL